MSTVIHTVNFPELEMSSALSLLDNVPFVLPEPDAPIKMAIVNHFVVPAMDIVTLGNVLFYRSGLIRQIIFSSTGWQPGDYFILYKNKKEIVKTGYVKEFTEVYLFNREYLVRPDDVFTAVFVNTSQTSKEVNMFIQYQYTKE